jgi:hypothetical protein
VVVDRRASPPSRVVGKPIQLASLLDHELVAVSLNGLSVSRKI